MANSTLMFSGINPEGRNSSKVLRPPGGGSSLGSFAPDCEEAPKAQQSVEKAAKEKNCSYFSRVQLDGIHLDNLTLN